jgi:hypothetical protein
MNKIIIGILLGVIAGIIDLIPMILQNLSWDANLSAFSRWVVVGFLTSVTEIKINQIFKSILIAFLVLLPTAILLAWKDPVTLIPITIMTIILGGYVGFFFKKLSKITQKISTKI